MSTFLPDPNGFANREVFQSVSLRWYWQTRKLDGQAAMAAIGPFDTRVEAITSARAWG